MITATQVFTFLGLMAGAVSAIIFLVRPVLRMTSEWRVFRGDWEGVQDRPGFPGHAGMAERMVRVENDVAAIKAALTTNGGMSLADAIRRIEAQLRLTAQHNGTPMVAIGSNSNGEQAA